jgi:hypothetical protein
MAADEYPGPNDHPLVDYGVIKERVDNLVASLRQYQLDTQQYQRDTNERFIRVENHIAEGFRQSQADREAGNKALGEMISEARKETRELSAGLSRGQGAFGMGSKIIGVIVTIFAAALGGWLSHVAW